MNPKIVVPLVLAIVIAGCTSAQPPKQPAAAAPQQPSAVGTNEEFNKHLALAKLYCERRNWDAAIVECAEMLRIDPTNPELQSIYQTARRAQLTERAAQVAAEATHTERRADLDAKEKELIPPNYGARKLVDLPQSTLKPPETAAEKLLKKPVTMNLENADLSAILEQLSKSTGIQYIADANVLADKKITVRVENTPLKEILDYLSRNLGIAFFTGENILWVTAAAGQQGPFPMETRIYRLRKGINLPEAEQIDTEQGVTSTTGGPQQRSRSPMRPRMGRGGLGLPGGINIPGLPRRGGGQQPRLPLNEEEPGSLVFQEQGPGGGLPAGGGGETTPLEEILERFVPPPPGAARHFSRDAHVLIVRDTPENLRLIENLIEALDVTPRQVLIEARFITIGVDDLRQLGIDWVLESDYTVTKRAGDRTETKILKGTGFQVPPVANAPTPTFNLTYKGVLTDPMFQVVLKALDKSGKSRTLAVPRVTTVNNRAAKIRFGEDFRYYENFQLQTVTNWVAAPGLGGSLTQVTQNVLAPTGTPTLEELGTQLVVLPSVGEDSDAITLTLVPQIKDFVRYEDFPMGTGTVSAEGTVSGSVIRLPIFAVSEVATRVVVRSGDTVVLGGLVKTKTLRGQSKVPILGDLPLVGRLFRHSSDSEERNNLLIFVTATLISYSGESLVPVRPAGAGGKGP